MCNCHDFGVGEFYVLGYSLKGLQKLVKWIECFGSHRVSYFPVTFWRNRLGFLFCFAFFGKKKLVSVQELHVCISLGNWIGNQCSSVG